MESNKKIDIDNIIKEFVDEEGYPIKGGIPNNTLETVTGPAQTGEVHSKQSMSPIDFYRSNFLTSPWSIVGSNTVSMKENKNMIYKTKQQILDEDLIFGEKTIGSDILHKNEPIPNIDSLKLNKKDVFIASQNFINVVNKSVLDETEKVILLNYLLTKINIQNVSAEYKEKLKYTIK